MELGVYVGSALQAIEVEAGYSPTNIKPSYCAVLNNLQVTTSDVVCNRFHRYARHVNFFAVVKLTQDLTTLREYTWPALVVSNWYCNYV